jgi:hypothetical protein
MRERREEKEDSHKKQMNKRYLEKKKKKANSVKNSVHTDSKKSTTDFCVPTQQLLLNFAFLFLRSACTGSNSASMH